MLQADRGQPVAKRSVLPGCSLMRKYVVGARDGMVEKAACAALRWEAAACHAACRCSRQQGVAAAR